MSTLYSLYVEIGETRHFVQRGFVKEDLMKPLSTISRWMAQMGIQIPSNKQVMLVIYEDIAPILQSRYTSTKVHWKPPV